MLTDDEKCRWLERQGPWVVGSIAIDTSWRLWALAVYGLGLHSLLLQRLEVDPC